MRSVVLSAAFVATACSSVAVVDVAETAAGAAVDQRAEVAPVVASAPPLTTTRSPTTAPAPMAPTTAEPKTAEPMTAAPTPAAPTAVPTTAVPTTAVPTTAVPTTAVRSRRPIVIGVAGDTTFTHGLTDRGPFDDVRDLLRGPDLMIVNLETAVADVGVGSPVDKRFVFRSSPESLDLLVEAGVDAVALGNNHVLDYGPDGVAQTLRELDARGIDHVGAGLDSSAAYTPLVVDVGDWTVGLVSFSRVPCDWSASGQSVRPQVAWACPPFSAQFESSVAVARAASDLVVVMIHGGEEGVLCPSPFMLDLEEQMAALGADVIINGHPHMLQGVTSVDRGDGSETLVAHSSGNFAFPPAQSVSANSAVFLIELAEKGVSLRVEPVRVAGGVVQHPSDAQRHEILDQMNRFSDGWQLDQDGRMRPAPEAVAAC